MKSPNFDEVNTGIEEVIGLNKSNIETFRTIFADDLRYEGNRALIFTVEAELPKQELRLCIKMALRYHLDKNTREFASL